MPTETYTITRRPGWSFLGELKVEIECDPFSPSFVKLGLAVRAAFKSGADLSGADLYGANLSGADLSGADLYGANLSGAYLSGEKITRLVARLDRSDGYQFAAYALEAGGLKIKAGCRWFTPAEYRAHVASEYPGTDKAVETLAMLDFIDLRAAQLGIVEKPKRVRKVKAAA